MMRKILSLSFALVSSKQVLIIFPASSPDMYQSHQATCLCPLYSSDTGSLCFPRNQRFLTHMATACCLFYLRHLFIHVSLKKCLLNTKYVTGAGDMLINEIRPVHTHGGCILIQLLLSFKLSPTFPSDFSSILFSLVKFF